MKNATLAKRLTSIFLAVLTSMTVLTAVARDASTHIRTSRAEPASKSTSFSASPLQHRVFPALTPTPTPTPRVNGDIAFTHFGNPGGSGLEQIATIKEDGSDLTTLTFGAHAEDPAFSSDGSKIAYATTHNNSFQLWAMNADGSQQTQLTGNSQRGDYEPAWSPDGTRLAFVGNNQIWVVNADGTNEVKLSDGTTIDDYPDWSPDGSKIAFTKDAMSGNAQIYVMDTDGSNLVNLSDNFWADRDPAWSPDGSQIAYHSFQDGHYEIYVMNADGSQQTQLTKTAYEVSNQEPAWSPDGSQIAFTSNRDDNNAEIYVMSADGSQQTRLTDDPAQDSHPSWGSYMPPPPPPPPSPTPAELSLSAAVSPDSIASGETVLYSVGVSNDGPATASAVQLSHLLPAGVSVTDINNNHGSCTSEPDESSGGTRLNCALGDMANAETKSITLTATGTAASYSWLQAVITVSSDTPDTFNSDNFAFPAFTILGPPEASVWLYARAQPSVVAPNGTITFNSTVYNYGPNQATGASMTATLPSGVTVNTAATPDVACTITPLGGGGTTVFCPLGDMDIYAVQTVTISATVNTADDATLQATLTVSSTLPDPQTWDNTANVMFLVRQPSPGPGGKLVFVSHRDGNAEIYLTNADGSGLVNLTNDPAYDREPAWSPDGTRLVFNSDRSGTGEVWVMNADGSNPTQLTTNDSHGLNFVWSPDGTKIAWQNYSDGDYDICVVNADGTGFSNLTDDILYQDKPQWSPDGSKILYESLISSTNWKEATLPEIFVMNADGSNQTNLSNAPAVSDSAPVWSPDGSQIAFSRGNGNGSPNQGIYLMNADGSLQVNLTQTESDGFPSWSPDGSQIAFSRFINNRQMIFVMNADGSNQAVTFAENYNGNAKPEWSPDGTGLAFATYLNGNSEIYVMNTNGGGLTNVTNDAEYDSEVMWQPTIPLSGNTPAAEPPS